MPGISLDNYSYVRRTSTSEFTSLIPIQKESKLQGNNDQSLDVDDNGLKSEKKEGPWTILVSHMKLLWTLEIRDSVMSIIQDLLFGINFMKVNSRGTHQLMASLEEDEQSDLNDILLNHSSVRTESKNIQGIHESHRIEDDSVLEETSFETIVQGCGRVHVAPIQNQVDFNKTEPPRKSHLDYLLNSYEDGGSDDSQRRSLPPVGMGQVTEAAKFMTMASDHTNYAESMDVSTGYNISLLSSIPTESDEFDDTYKIDSMSTFNVYLSNPQIQLHSASTGGSVILAIHCAIVEGKKFMNLFATDDYNFTADSLLRRTEFLYTLDKMEIYSLENNVEVDAGLQWLETKMDFYEVCGNEIPRVLLRQKSKDNNHRQSTHKKFIPSLQQYDVTDFIIPELFKMIMTRCTFKTRQECHNPPFDLTKEELDDIICRTDITSLRQAVHNDRHADMAIDHFEMIVDELSFLLDSYQFTTTLDLIRNVLLEAPKPTRQRFYRSSLKDPRDENAMNDLKASEKINKNTNDNSIKSPILNEMEKAVFQWANENDNSKQYIGKRGRENLRLLAQKLLCDLEENQGTTLGPSIRRIEYTLSKAKWKIKSQRCLDDVEINFTGFKGVHDFSADGSVNSHISLEDLHMSSHKPGPDAIHFFDPTAILKTMVGVERSPCRQCGLEFNRTANESDSCIFHPGSFTQAHQIYQWTCCKSIRKDAPGCLSRPHTGKEIAIALRLDALPRVVEGLTMYKFIEGNFFPGIPHTLIVQLTKGLTQLFSNYFLNDDGENDDNREMLPLSIEQNVNVKSMISSDLSNAQINQTFVQKRSGFESEDEIYGKKTLLFGKKFTSQYTDVINGEYHDPNLLVEDEVDKTKQATNASKWTTDFRRKTRELIFVKYWRVGDIHLNVSIAGFNKIANVSNLDLSVPAFQKAYKIGTSNYLILKLVAHLVKSLASCGLEIIRDKISGKTHKRNPQRLNKGSEGSMQGKIIKGEGNYYTHDIESFYADLLLGAPVAKTKKKKKMWSKVNKE